MIVIRKARSHCLTDEGRNHPPGQTCLKGTVRRVRRVKIRAFGVAPSRLGWCFLRTFPISAEGSALLVSVTRCPPLAVFLSSPEHSRSCKSRGRRGGRSIKPFRTGSEAGPGGGRRGSRSRRKLGRTGGNVTVQRREFPFVFAGEEKNAESQRDTTRKNKKVRKAFNRCMLNHDIMAIKELQWKSNERAVR